MARKTPKNLETWLTAFRGKQIMRFSIGHLIERYKQLRDLCHVQARRAAELFESLALFRNRRRLE
jgi:hypothetical protein